MVRASGCTTKTPSTSGKPLHHLMMSAGIPLASLHPAMRTITRWLGTAATLAASFTVIACSDDGIDGANDVSGSGAATGSSSGSREGASGSTGSGSSGSATSSGSGAPAGGAGGGGGDEYFQMDYSSGASPEAGWSLGIIDVESNQAAGRVTITRQAGVGPSGQDAYRIAIHDDGTDQFSTAWHGYPYTGAQRGPGTEVFFRFRFRPVTTGIGGYGQKIVLQQAEDNAEQSRVGLILQPWKSGYGWRGTHGGDLIVQTPGEYTDWNQWSNVQFSLTFHTVGNEDDGVFKIWRNNNDYNSPTAQAADTAANGIKAVADGSSNYYVIWSGSTHNPAGSDFIYEIADFEIGPTFEAM